MAFAPERTCDRAVRAFAMKGFAMKRFLALLVLAASLAGTWYVLSPWMAMKDLRGAAEAVDREALARQIDFPVLRENVKEQLRARIERDSAGPLERLGGAVAAEVADAGVDFAVNPTGMASLVTTGALVTTVLPDAYKPQAVSWEVERGGIDRFRARGTREDGSAAPTLQFERRGLSWKLVGLELPTIGE